jgi:cysteine-S-conjugate beta-lyase
MVPFTLPTETMRTRRAVKWRRYGDDVLPAFIADMDCTVAEPVQRAVRRIVEQQDYGYGHREGRECLEPAFADRMRERFGWEIDPAHVLPIADLIQGIEAAIVAFSEPGDGVVVQTPIYPPFLTSIDRTDRRRVHNQLVDDGRRLLVDEDGLRRAVDDRTRLVLLCNPHNPSGRVFEREELEAIGRIAVERDLVIVSDEIHCDLVYPGGRHIPTGWLGEEIAARTVTLNSATKGFNIAGLRCGVMHFGSDELLARFRRAIPDHLLGSVNMIGLDATVAAWREGQPWLDQVMERLRANRDRIAAWAAETGSSIRHHPPEATYLAWLDCAELDLPGTSPQEFFLREARVALGLGSEFGPGGETCVRLNFATSPPILEELLERMAGAIRRADLPARQSIC